jgi:hypothetical protein
MGTIRNIIFSTILLAVSVAICATAGEVFLRLKNNSMKNYDIEMWRYAKELKEPDADPDLSYDHVRSKSALLQGVNVRLNERGLRGESLRPIPPGGRRILFLGGSITFGWGVPEEDTVEVQLQDRLRDAAVAAQILNGGAGYSASRLLARRLLPCCSAQSAGGQIAQCCVDGWDTSHVPTAEQNLDLAA